MGNRLLRDCIFLQEVFVDEKDGSTLWECSTCYKKTLDGVIASNPPIRVMMPADIVGSYIIESDTYLCKECFRECMGKKEKK